MKVDPTTAVEIFRRFATWTDLLDLGELLSRRPEISSSALTSSTTDRFGTRVDLYLKDMDLLERMRERVETCIASGDYVMAQQLGKFVCVCVCVSSQSLSCPKLYSCILAA
jgi:hypothetical protein